MEHRKHILPSRFDVVSLWVYHLRNTTYYHISYCWRTETKCKPHNTLHFHILWRGKQNCHQKRHQTRHSVTSIVRSKVTKSLHPFSETCSRLVSTKKHMNRLFKYRFSHLLYRGFIYFFNHKRNSFTGVYLQCWRRREESYSSKLRKWRLTCSFS